MKINFLKQGFLLAAMAVTTLCYGQAKKKTVRDNSPNSNYLITSVTNGQQVEEFRTNWNGVLYKTKFVNDKMTELFVDGEQIPAGKWGDYNTLITKIREQIKRDKIQAKKDQEQAARDMVQVKKDQEQAGRDQLQAKRDAEQAQRDALHAKRDAEQAQRDQAGAGEAQVQAKRDQERARLDQLQAKKDQEQAAKDMVQAKRDQEQAAKDQIQAKKDQEQALQDQLLLKALISDLVKDKIVDNEKGVHDLTLNTDEMTVNGKKQPQAVFTKYKEKYNRFTHLNFSYGNQDGMRTYQGLHISN
jgi:colicin import membrane protein